MTDRPRNYDREYVAQVGAGLRRRLGYDHDRGEVTRFVLQLEYRLEDAWEPVVIYDHDPESEHGHDVSQEGLHVDVYRESAKARTEWVAPPMPAGIALDFAEDHLAQNSQRFVERFEEWHGIRSQ